MSSSYEQLGVGQAVGEGQFLRVRFQFPEGI